MAAAPTVTATCLCGACKFTAQAPPPANEKSKRYFCHCNSCRHTTGALTLTSNRWPEPIAHEALLANPELTVYPFTPNVGFHFCRTCGTHLFVTDKRDPPGIVEVLSGSLGAAPDCLFTVHQFVDDTRDGGLAAWIPRLGGQEVQSWNEGGGDSKVIDAGKVRAELSDEEKGASTFQAYCHCRGVHFEITRPDETSAVNPYVDSNNPKNSRGVWWLDAARKKYLGGLCACESCRLATGATHAPFGWAFITLSNLRALPSGAPYNIEDAVAAARRGTAARDRGADGGDLSTLRAYASSDRATRYFCGVCGAVVFYQAWERPGLLDVAVGILDAPEGVRAENWLAWRTDVVNYSADALDKGMVESTLAGMAAAKKADA